MNDLKNGAIPSALPTTPCTLDQGRVIATALPPVDLDANDILHAPGQIPPTLDMIQASGLLESITEQGQLAEAIVYTSPDLPPGQFYCADGNGRVLCLRVLGRKVKVRVLDHAPTKAELRRLRTATNLIRKDKAAAQDQLEADLDEEMAETGANQGEAALAMGISAGYASKLRSDSKLCPELHHLRDNKNICRDARRIIATMPTHELQMKLAEKVLAVAAKTKVKRDNVEAWAAPLKAELRGGKRKEKAIRIGHGGFVATIKGNVLETWKVFRAKMDEAVKALEKDPRLGPELLPSLMK